MSTPPLQVALTIDNQFAGAVNAQISFVNTDGNSVSVPAGGFLVAGGTKRTTDVALPSADATKRYSVTVRDGAAVDGVLLSNRSFVLHEADNSASVELGKWSTPAIILIVTLCILVLIAGIVICQRMLSAPAAGAAAGQVASVSSGLETAAAKAYGVAADHAWM